MVPLTEVVIAGAVRTPIGKFGGAMKEHLAPALGAIAARAAMSRSGIPVEAVDQVFFGHARQAANGPNPARQVGWKAGLPATSPAQTINMACGSGLQAILLAAQSIRLGEAEVVLAGGMESMSNTPYLMTEARWGYRMGSGELIDGMYRDGFMCPLSDQLMGRTAENLAEQYGISRQEQDEFAVTSQHKCERARKAGLFDAEITPVTVGSGKKAQILTADEHPRDGATVEGMGKLAPVFKEGGSVHAGNSSGITDGAAAMMVMSRAAAERLGVVPQVRLVAHAVAGVDPNIMGIGPVPAVRQLLSRTGLSLDDIDLIELNEAFAAQVIACDRELHLDPSRLNVNGGAIALGHPIGATGSRIVVTLIHELLRRDARRGLATLCISGGMGLALLIERV